MTDPYDLLEQVAQFLGEHFDAVQIHASILEEGQTRGFHLGAGNYYARRAMSQEFIEGDRIHDQAVEIADQLQGRT